VVTVAVLLNLVASFANLAAFAAIQSVADAEYFQHMLNNLHRVFLFVDLLH
jgi:hypothetical protein